MSETIENVLRRKIEDMTREELVEYARARDAEVSVLKAALREQPLLTLSGTPSKALHLCPKCKERFAADGEICNECTDKMHIKLAQVRQERADRKERWRARRAAREAAAVAAMLFLSLSLATAQPKRFASVPFWPCDFDSVKAAMVWTWNWETLMPDTVYNLYQGGSIYFRDTNAVWAEPAQFRCDSIRGRGDRRMVLMTHIQKTNNPLDWIWVRAIDLFDTTYMVPDSVVPGLKNSIKIEDTLMIPTPDSTFRFSIWLPYTRKDYWNQVVQANGIGMGHFICSPFYQKGDTASERTKTLKWWIEKVIGDPNVNGGKDQLVRFRMAYYGHMPKNLWDLLKMR